MAIVKSNYVKRGKGERARAKATIRYIQHRRDRDGARVTRTLFGYDGTLTREQAYKMIDDAERGTIFYRFVLSPDPAREDRYKDLDLSEITIHTMLALEERLGKQIQFVATLHDDHSPHRHIHSLVLVQGARLNREDFKALRLEATARALFQRRLRDRIRGHHLGHYRSHTNRNISRQHQSTLRRLSGGSRPYQSYTCPLCHYHQALPASNRGYRCPACGLRMRRERISEVYRTQRREVGLAAGFSP
jgi:DNA-directed RNA polymerase subunit RPC12/RpoP